MHPEILLNPLPNNNCARIGICKSLVIEVKFRANETYNLNDLPKDYPYDNAFFIVVSKKHIKCITVPEIREGKEISPASRNYLGSRREFDLDKDTIVQFCDFAVEFFDGVYVFRKFKLKRYVSPFQSTNKHKMLFIITNHCSNR